MLSLLIWYSHTLHLLESMCTRAGLYLNWAMETGTKRWALSESASARRACRAHRSIRLSLHASCTTLRDFVHSNHAGKHIISRSRGNLQVADRVLVRDRRRAEARHTPGEARPAGPVPAETHSQVHASLGCSHVQTSETAYQQPTDMVGLPPKLAVCLYICYTWTRF